jgi:co-chaperonin GroES (HSP10)
MIQNFLHSIDKFVIVGDRVLLKPRDMQMQTESGLILPATVKEKENIKSGYVVKTGPGYPIPSQEISESWKEEDQETRYIGMQAQQSDLAIYLDEPAHEIEFEQEKYVIIPHNAILLLIRDEME